MASLDTIVISYKGSDFPAVFIPDVFTGENRKLLIGSHSLNVALYDDSKGYVDEDAKEIDALFYAFVNDEYFSLTLEKFVENVRFLLD